MPPTFICPGAQKAGTTWLHRQLRRHPDFWMPPQKEMDYLDLFPASRRKYAQRKEKVLDQLAQRPGAAQTIAWWQLFTSDWAPEKYLELFAFAEGKLSGDVSPNYSMLGPVEIGRAAELVPEAKIVFLLRDPAQRAWAHARHTVARGPRQDLSDAQKLAAMEEFALSDRCRANGDYLSMLSTWRAAFGAAQVHVGYYDDLVAQPVALLNSILSFLGAGPVPREQEAELGEVINRGVAYPLPEALRERLEAHYAPMLAELKELVPEAGRPAWLRT